MSRLKMLEIRNKGGEDTVDKKWEDEANRGVMIPMESPPYSFLEM